MKTSGAHFGEMLEFTSKVIGFTVFGAIDFHCSQPLLFLGKSWFWERHKSHFLPPWGPPPNMLLTLNEIAGDDIQSRSRSEMRLYLNEISGDDIKSRSEIEMRRCKNDQKVTFWGFQNLCYSLWKTAIRAPENHQSDFTDKTWWILRLCGAAGFEICKRDTPLKHFFDAISRWCQKQLLQWKN